MNKPFKRKNHGMSSCPEYQIWEAMIQRCTNKNIYRYDRYGGRGIKVCDRWRQSFLSFYKDMGKKPFPNAQIDRINNNGNYEPSNCQWVTPLYNLRHSSKAKLSMEKAREIRLMYQNNNALKYREIANIYGVSKRAIGNVITNQRWREDAK